jgi:hypothetical protein
VPRPLFLIESRKGVATLSVTKEFYERSGRRALHDSGAAAPRGSAGTSGDPAQDARRFFEHGGDAERWLAIRIVGQMVPDAVPADLVAQLREVVHGHPQASYRAAALAAAPHAAALSEGFGLAAWATGERDPSALTELLAKAAQASGQAQVNAATTILLSLLHVGSEPVRPIAAVAHRALWDADVLVATLQTLAMVAARDVSFDLKRFLLANSAVPRNVLDEAMKALVTIAERHDVDLGIELLADVEVLKAVALHEAIAGQIAGVLCQRGPLPGAAALLAAGADADVTLLLRSVIVEAARQRDDSTARLLLTRLGAASEATAVAQPPDPAGASAIPSATATVAQRRLREVLIGPALAGTVKPWLDEAWQASLQRNPDDGPMVERARAALAVALEASGKQGSLHETLAMLKGTPPWSRTGHLANSATQVATSSGIKLDPAATLTGLGTAYATAYKPLRRSVSLRFDRWGALLLLVSPLPFIATLFVPGDLPDGASPGMVLLARTISLGLPVTALLLPWVLISGQASREFAQSRASIHLGTGDDGRQQWQQYALMPLLVAVYGLLEAHKQYVGPLTFWPTQLALFMLNGAALGLGAWGVSRMIDERWSGGYVV